MHNSKLDKCIVLVFLSTILLSSALAFDYRPGVSKGQYVKYGNFVGIGPGLEAYNNNDWIKYEVVEINGTQATLVLTGRFKNGTAILGNGDAWLYDTTLPGVVNGTESPQGPIIAGGLVKGYMVTPVPFDTINDTVTQSYLGVSRLVNVLNYTYNNDTLTRVFTYFFDQESGMLLEVKGLSIENPNSVTRQFSYIVTETNIFGQILPIEYIYIIAAITISVIVILAVAVKKGIIGKRKHRKRIR
jgi:hypothetical protein